jgi:hypothetical protein
MELMLFIQVKYIRAVSPGVSPGEIALRSFSNLRV